MLTRHFFAPSEFGFAKTLDADMLQSRIMSKNKRVSSYYTQCTHCWLVIAYDVSGFASFYTAVPSLCDSEYDILFDRVILFNGTIGTVTELKAKPGAPQG